VKAIVLAAPGRIEMRDVPRPEPGAGQVLIRTAACGICATDLVMIDGNPRVKCPAILGHEWSGVVEAAGKGAPRRLVGKPCVAENVLADGGEVGFEHPGGYGQFFVTEAAGVNTLPDGFDMAVATLIEPLAVCVRALNNLGESNQGDALILGDGPIGLLMLVLLKHVGAPRVLLAGGRPGRLKLARQLGACEALNYHVQGEVSRRAYEWGVVVEASGSLKGMTTALNVAGQCAKILVLGDYGDARADFAWNDLLHRELMLTGSNASADAWPEAVRLATDPAFPLRRLVSVRLPAERFAEGIDLVHSRAGDVVKVVLEW